MFGLSLDRCVGLHERIEIHYVVDGYVAQLFVMDERLVAESRGHTIHDALLQLDALLTFKSLDDVRIMMEIKPFSSFL
jgi:hypothetical protein